MFLIATNKYEFDISVTKSKEGGDHGNKKNNVQNNVKHGKPKFSAGTENMPKLATPKTRVFVSNLDFSVNERNLRDVFRFAGRVVLVELNRDKEGKSKGHGVVEFLQPEEAENAIKFNDRALFNRKMAVRFDEKKPLASPNSLPKGLDSLPEGLNEAKPAPKAASGGGKAPRKKVFCLFLQGVLSNSGS